LRTALVTGTSSGFGLLTTVELASRGWRVFATMRDLERRPLLDQAVARAGVGARVETFCLDVTDPCSMQETVRLVLSRTGGRLDAVVHNAGVALGAASFEDLPWQELRRVMETNFFGVLELTRMLLPIFRAQRHGRILVVSSSSGLAGEPFNSAYCASKWAIEGWAESLAYEVTPFGIEIILVEPGIYRTEILNNAREILPRNIAYLPLLAQVEQVVAALLKKYARKPEEVAIVIAGALDARRPRFRYSVGPDARITHLARGKIPTRLWREAVTRLLGLNRVAV
jgi:NAD(P)-dependent dehydrogenase (short-subunit alcohol dehydrogenase family)